MLLTNISDNIFLKSQGSLFNWPGKDKEDRFNMSITSYGLKGSHETL